MMFFERETLLRDIAMNPKKTTSNSRLGDLFADIRDTLDNIRFRLEHEPEDPSVERDIRNLAFILDKGTTFPSSNINYIFF